MFHRKSSEINKQCNEFTSFLSSPTLGSDSFMTSPLCTPFSSYKISLRSSITHKQIFRTTESNFIPLRFRLARQCVCLRHFGSPRRRLLELVAIQLHRLVVAVIPLLLSPRFQIQLCRRLLQEPAQR